MGTLYTFSAAILGKGRRIPRHVQVADQALNALLERGHLLRSVHVRDLDRGGRRIANHVEQRDDFSDVVARRRRQDGHAQPSGLGIRGIQQEAAQGVVFLGLIRQGLEQAVNFVDDQERALEPRLVRAPLGGVDLARVDEQQNVRELRKRHELHAALLEGPLDVLQGHASEPRNEVQGERVERRRGIARQRVHGSHVDDAHVGSVPSGIHEGDAGAGLARPCPVVHQDAALRGLRPNDARHDHAHQQLVQHDLGPRRWVDGALVVVDRSRRRADWLEGDRFLRQPPLEKRVQIFGVRDG